MKKTFFFMAALLFASMSTFTLTSCGDDDDNEIKENSDPGAVYNTLATVTLAETPFANTARKLTVEDNSEVKSIEITENGNCIIEIAGASAATRASVATNYIFGTAKLDASGNIIATAGNYSISIPMFQALKVVINGQDVKVKEEASDIKASSKTNHLCRTWTPVKYHAYITSGGKVYFNEDNYTNINDLQKVLFKYILGSTPKDSDYIIKNNIDYIIFSKAGSFAMVYNNGESENKTWNWLDEDGNLTILNADGGKFINATTKFSGNTMYLLIDVDINVKSDAIKIDEINAKLVVTLSSK